MQLSDDARELQRSLAALEADPSQVLLIERPLVHAVALVLLQAARGTALEFRPTDLSYASIAKSLVQRLHSDPSVKEMLAPLLDWRALAELLEFERSGRLNGRLNGHSSGPAERSMLSVDFSDLSP
jgi:hypothetical protein